MVKLNKIYTKTGDKGKTGLVDGSRRLKNDLRVSAYGDVDEANSCMGLILSELSLVEANKPEVRELLDKIKKILSSLQHDLFDLGADLAQPFADEKMENGVMHLVATGEPLLIPHVVDETKTQTRQDLRITEAQVKKLEEAIDELNSKLPPLTSFILPAGSRLVSLLHLARAITRRAERQIVALSLTEAVNLYALQYINRLSDLLFVMARLVARSIITADGVAEGEVLWQAGKNR